MCITANDGRFSSDSQCLHINVLDANEQPIILQETPDVTVYDDETEATYLGQVGCEDPDGDSLIYSLLSEPIGGPFSINSTGKSTVCFIRVS